MSEWNSGLDWRYTSYHPVIFWGVQAEFIYLFVILIVSQTWFVFKLLLLLLALTFIGGAMGFGFRQLARRYNRWRLAGVRPIYSVEDNICRISREN